MPSNPRVPFRLPTERPYLPPPDGRPLIIHPVVAIELWPFEEPTPRTLLSPRHGEQPVPDIPNWSWAEYGMRCGLPRLLKVFGDRDLPADACINAGVIDTYPQAADAIASAGWEVQGHGMRQAGAAPTTETENIHLSIERIKKHTGQPVRGWIGPGLSESFETPDLLKQAGIDYLCDWVIDDVPCWLTTRHGPLVAVPYTLELNDSVIYAVERQSSPEQYNRLTHTLDALENERDRNVHVLTLSFHTHLSGVLHRIGFVAKMLDLLLERSDTIFMTGSQICDWFTTHAPEETSSAR